ncbi:hypothetical protein LSAT2_029751, partial [Lamellibrachia satsuma]
AALLVGIYAPAFVVVDGGTSGGDEPTAGECGNETTGLPYYASPQMLLRPEALLVVVYVAVVVDRGTAGRDEPTTGECGNETMGLAYYACLYPFDRPDCGNVSGEFSPENTCHNEFSVFVRFIN